MRIIPDDAFEAYVALGPARSYQALADRYSVSKRAIAKRAGREGWTERLAKIEREAREESDRKLVKAMGEYRETHVKAARAVLMKGLAALRQLPLGNGMDAVRAVEAAIKLERTLAGEASERTALNIEETTRRELGRWLMADEEEGDEEAEAEQVPAV